MKLKIVLFLNIIFMVLGNWILF